MPKAFLPGSAEGFASQSRHRRSGCSARIALRSRVDLHLRPARQPSPDAAAAHSAGQQSAAPTQRQTTSAETLNTSSSVFVSGSGAVTLSGTGTAGFDGDGGVATSSELDGPTGIAEDRQGDLFIADTGNCRIREVPAADGTHFGERMSAGHVYTIAGGPCDGAARSSTSSSGGNVGFATSLAVDSAGDVFVADGTGDEVLELPAVSGEHFGTFMSAGKLSVVAGDGSAGDAGDGQPASAAQLNDPQGVGLDPSRRPVHRRHRELRGTRGSRHERDPMGNPDDGRAHLHRRRYG